MELKCVKVYAEVVQSHFSPRAAIRYQYYRCLCTSARFNLTPLLPPPLTEDQHPHSVLLRAAFCLHPSMAFSSYDAATFGIANCRRASLSQRFRLRDVPYGHSCRTEERDNM